MSALKAKVSSAGMVAGVVAGVDVVVGGVSIAVDIYLGRVVVWWNQT